MSSPVAVFASKAFTSSSFDWVNVAPKGWEVVRLKFLLKERNERSVTGAEELLSLSKYQGVVPKSSLEERAGQAESLIGYKLISPGQLVLNKMQAVNGLLAVSSLHGLTSPDYSVYEVQDDERLQVDYLAYLLLQPEYQAEFKRRVTGVMEGFIRLYTDDLYDIECLVPPIETQRRIVRFLDSQVAKVDQAIGIKNRQIQLLEERKNVLIRNAVTHGLNPDVALKDSQISWLGMVPSHWQLKRLKYVVKIIKRIVGYEGPDVLSITQRGIKVKDIASGEGQLAMDYSKYQVVNKGDFAMNHLDLLTGYVDISRYEGVTSPDYRVFTNVDDSMTDEYLLLIFQLGYKQKIFYRFGQGVSRLGRWRLPSDSFKNFVVPVPPKEEQLKIVRHVQAEVGRVDKAKKYQERQVKALKEYKEAIINSVVTGRMELPN